VTQPDFLQDTHRGWGPEKVIKDGPATEKIEGWIRNTYLIYPAPDTSQTRVGYLSPPSSVLVADDGSGWLCLICGPIKNEGTNDSVESPQFDPGHYIEKSKFTTELPGRWHRE